MGITIDDAMKRSVRSFYDGYGFDEYENKTQKPVKYSHDLFDSYEKKLNRSNGIRNAKRKIEDSEGELDG